MLCLASTWFYNLELWRRIVHSIDHGTITSFYLTAGSFRRSYIGRYCIDCLRTIHLITTQLLCVFLLKRSFSRCTCWLEP